MTYMRGFGQITTKAGGGAHVQPTTESGPSHYVEPRGPYGYTSFGISTIWINYLMKLGERIQATTNAIRETGLVTTPYPKPSLVGCDFQTRVFYEDILTPPGVIMIFGVPFTVDQLEAGHLAIGFDQQFVPNPEQRLLLDYTIYVKSQAIVAAMMDGRGCGKNLDVSIDSNYGTWTERNPVQRLITPRLGGVTGSIRAINEACGFTTWIDGYSFNPIQPTEDELNGEGGLRRYYERGGFLLSKAIVNGTKKLDNTGIRGLHWPVGYYVCGDRPVPALFYHSGEGDGWDIFVELDGVGGYGLRVQPNSQETGQKILSGIAAIMAKFRELLCGVLPFAAPIAQQKLLAELCIDKVTGQTCAKGAPNCKCTPPSTAQKDAVAASMALANKVCAMGQEAPSTPPTPDQISPPPVPPRVDPWRPKWWMIVLGGLGVGAGVFFVKR